MQAQTRTRDANIERFRQMLTELADEGGIVRGLTAWKLADLFNERYAKEIKPITQSGIRGYINAGKTAGWLSTREWTPGTPMTFTIVANTNELGGTA